MTVLEIPAKIVAETCNCGKRQGWYFNETRKMWVCDNCHKPSPWHRHSDSPEAYIRECANCEELYVIEQCPDPGGGICKPCCLAYDFPYVVGGAIT